MELHPSARETLDVLDRGELEGPRGLVRLAHLPATFVRRWGNVLTVAAAEGNRRLVLGASGCGAFGNDPELVARAFLEAWPRFATSFDEVTFAIPTWRGRSARNHAAFQRLLG